MREGRLSDANWPSCRMATGQLQHWIMQRGVITLSLLAACALQSYAAHQDVLVLVEDASVRSTHSVFLDDLRQQGWKLTVKSAEDKTLRLRDWDDWLYSKIAIFASTIPGQALLVASNKHVYLVPCIFGR